MIHGPLLLHVLVIHRDVTRIIATHLCSPGPRISTACHIIVIIITWMLDTQLSHVHTALLHMLTARVYMHVLFLSSCHMDSRAYYMYYCSMLSLYSCYMLVSRY